MSTATLEQHTYLPSAAQGQEVEKVHLFLSHHEARHGSSPVPQYVLSGPEPGDRVELPPEVHRALVHVVEALSSGRAVTVAPQSMTLTTQQAADLLNVSRPTVVKLLDQGVIPHERVGHHRKVRLRDVLSYRERRRAEQYAALAATSVDLSEEDSAEEVVTQLRAVRRELAQQRRARRSRPQEPGEA